MSFDPKKNDDLIRLSQLTVALNDFMAYKIGACFRGKSEINPLVDNMRNEIATIERRLK